MKNRKGFTMTELLAVIVILALLMTLSIPAVIRSLQSSKKKTFTEYANRVKLAAEEKYFAEGGDIQVEKCVIYDIKSDLGLSDTNTYSGYLLINNEGGDLTYFISMWSKDYTINEYLSGDFPSAQTYKYYFTRFDNDLSVDNLQKNNMTSENKKAENAMSDLCYGTNTDIDKESCNVCLKADMTTQVEKVNHCDADHQSDCLN